MRLLRRRNWFLCGWLWIAGLMVAAGSGCQLGPELGPAPDPFYPKEMLKLFPTKAPTEYSMSEEAAALKAAKADQAERAK
jgi:hypothetical protein